MKFNETKFYSYIDKTPSCWNWSGADNLKYGVFSVFVDGRWKNILAHRLMVIITKGKIPKGMCIDHICKNTLCVNPEHLRIVTTRQNVLENSVGICANHIKKTHCKNGHLLSGGNLGVRTTPSGNKTRKCKICTKINWEKGRDRQRIKCGWVRKVPYKPRKKIYGEK